MRTCTRSTRRTGAATKVGECGCYTDVSAARDERIGLAVDSSGRMYLKDHFQLLRVNQISGTLFSPVDLTDADPRDMLAFGPNDELYTGSRDTFNNLAPQTFGLRTIDPSDGTVSLLGSNPGAEHVSTRVGSRHHHGSGPG